MSTALVVYSTARIMFTFWSPVSDAQLDFQKCPLSDIIWRSLYSLLLLFFCLFVSEAVFIGKRRGAVSELIRTKRL